MKVIAWPIILVIIGMVIAQYFFDIDIERLFEGFVDFITTILDGPG